MTQNSLALKDAKQPKNLPFSAEGRDWLKVVFGRKLEKVEVSRWKCENVISKDDVFASPLHAHKNHNLLG